MITIGVIVLALLATKPKSTDTNGSPTLTLSPCLMCAVKPSPSSDTVSIPIWIKYSTPASDKIPIACFVGKILIISPLTGDTNSPSDGSIAIPSPSNFSANVGSGASVISTISPLTGAYTTSSVTF